MESCDGNKCLTGSSQINFLIEDKDVLKISSKMLVSHTHTNTPTHIYKHIYTYVCVYLYVYMNKNFVPCE